MIFRLPPLFITFAIATCIGGACIAMTAMVPRNRAVLQQTIAVQNDHDFGDRWMGDQSVLKKQDRLEIAPRPQNHAPDTLIVPPPTPVEIVSHDDDMHVNVHKPKVRSERNICTRHGMRKVVTRGGRSWRCRR